MAKTVLFLAVLQVYDGMKSDMWACGVILFTMLEATYPFQVGDSAGVGGGNSKFVAGDEADLERLSTAQKKAFQKSLVRCKGPTQSMCLPLVSPLSNYNKCRCDHTFQNLRDDLLVADYTFVKHKQASSELRDLMAKLLEKDPAKRFTALDVLHHPWIKNDSAEPWTNAYVDKLLDDMGHQEVTIPEEVPDDPECWLKVQMPSPRVRGALQTAAPMPDSSAVAQLEAAMAERDALLELKREKQAREQAEAKASLARTRSAEKASELAAAKAELARLRAGHWR